MIARGCETANRSGKRRAPFARTVGTTGWLKVERPAGTGRAGTGTGAGMEEKSREREHNVSHSARSCIFYDMASNLTSRARHNSRPCSPCARPPRTTTIIVLLSLFLSFAILLFSPTFCSVLAYAPISRVHACASNARARMRNRPTHACAHALRTRDRYACVRAHRNH